MHPTGGSLHVFQACFWLQVFAVSHRLTYHPPNHHALPLLPRPAAALPPPLPRFSPTAINTVRTHLDLLPVPRVPFVSQVCQLAIVITHAAATDSLYHHNDNQAPSRILYETIFAQCTSQPQPSSHPLPTPETASRPHTPYQTLPAAAITSTHHHARSSNVTKPQVR